jgi:hypothetical protein
VRVGAAGTEVMSGTVLLLTLYAFSLRVQEQLDIFTLFSKLML